MKAKHSICGWILSAALLSGCGDVGGPAPISPPDPPSPTGMVLFLGGSPRHIYVVNADGTGLRQLTSGPDDLFAFWSQDGTRIYFGRHTDGPDQLLVMNSDGSDIQAIASLPPGEGDGWSPDGTREAFAAYLPSPEDSLDKEQLDLYVMNADSTDLSRIVDLRDPWNCTGFTDCTDIVSIAWSPTGEWIAYSTWLAGRALRAYAHLGIVRPDGRQNRYLVADYASDGNWSPDGQRLAYSHGENGYIPEPKSVAVIGLDGGDPTIVIDGNADSTLNFSPAWTTDGSHLVFSRSRVGHSDSSEIFVVRAAGTGLRRIAGIPGGTFVQDVKHPAN